VAMEIIILEEFTSIVKKKEPAREAGSTRAL
jgi:hypothetical protein